MSTPEVDWEQTVIGRHIDDPYGADAFAESYKEVIDVGAVDFPSLPDDDDSVLYTDVTIKSVGEAQLNARNRFTDLAPMHEMFLEAARAILGKDRFTASKVWFVENHNYVRPNEYQRFAAARHLDGYRSRSHRSFVRLIGVSFDALPTHVYQGSFSPDDVYTHDMPGGIEAGDLKTTPATENLTEMPALACGRLLLMPPSLPHASRMATELTDRHFMRWTLWV